MKLLAISGSARRGSTNTALLMAMRSIAPADIAVDVFDGIGGLPIFSPDLEGPDTPDIIRRFQRSISQCDGIIISSPEYARGLPGGLKNALDWLVSGDQIVGKPIALVHASHRGEDMLASLRLVLSTISSHFNEDLFFRLPAMKETPEAIFRMLSAPAKRQSAEKFLLDFAEFCRERRDSDAAV